MSTDRPPIRGWRRGLKWGASFAVTIVVALIVLQVTFPWWLAQITPLIAKQLDVDQLTIVARRPDWNGVTIDQLSVSSAAFRAQAQGVRVSYTVSGLLRSRVERVDADSVDLAVHSSDEASSNAPTTAPSIPGLPLDVLSVAELVMRFPDTGFVGRGQATLGQAGLRFKMDGEQPEAASKLRVDATLTRTGAFSVRIGERTTPDTHFVTLDGTMSGNTLTVRGDVVLDGFPLSLASSLAGLPAGQGRVAAVFDTALPWPLPDPLVWTALDADLSTLSVDWKGDDLELDVRQLTGRAQLRSGVVEANLAGELAYGLDGRTVSARLAPDFALRFGENTLRGEAGLSITSSTEGQDMRADIVSFTVRNDGEQQLDLITDLTVQQSAETVRSRFGIAAAIRSPSNFSASVRLANSDPSPAFFSTTGTWSDAAASASGRVTLTAAALDFVSAVAGGPVGKGQITADFRADMSRPATGASAVFGVQLPALTIDWASADKTTVVKGLKGSARYAGGEVDANLGGLLNYRLDEREVSVRLPAGYRLRLANDVLRGGAGAKISSVQGDENIRSTVRDFKLQLGERTRLDLDADVEADFGAARARGRTQAHVILTDTRAPNVQGKLSFRGTLETEGQSREGTLETEYRLRGPALAATGSYVTDGIGSIPFNLKVDTATTAGILTAEKKFEFLAPAAKIFVPDWDAVYDVDRGKIAAALAFNWSDTQSIAADVRLSMTDVAAHYEDYFFYGIQGDLHLTTNDITDDALWQLQPTELRMTRVDAGLTLTDVTMGVAYSQNQMRVAQAVGMLLGGRASTTAFNFDTEAGSATMDVMLDGIDLAQVLALEGDDISGSGLLDGVLPMVVADYQPTVSKGIVRARPPGGTIRLASPLIKAGGRMELSFALDALNDFRYSKLEVGVDYASNGDLDLGVKLQGRNPRVEKDRPIHYNLNISENIPVLLESLRLKDKLNEDIERRFNK